MSYLRQLCAVFALACVFTVSARAGDISCGVADQPPPPPPPVTQSATINEIAATLLQSVLALF